MPLLQWLVLKTAIGETTLVYEKAIFLQNDSRKNHAISGAGNKLIVVDYSRQTLRKSS